MNKNKAEMGRNNKEKKTQKLEWLRLDQQKGLTLMIFFLVKGYLTL